MPQYFKLRKKAQAGARFVIKQIGWDTRKDDELLRYVRREELDLFAVANVYLLSRGAARVFRAGKIPGVVVSDALLQLAERHGASPDKGRAFFVDLAAKHLAVARGLGYKGVYLGGHMPAETYGEIIDLAGTFGADDWRELAREIRYPLAGEFYLFEADPETGLSSDVVSSRYLASKRARRTDLRVPFKYRFSRRFHDTVFAHEAPLFPAARALLPRRREGAPATSASGARHRAGGEGAALRLRGLRRLLAVRDRVRVPGVAVREEPAERALRRHARRPVRGVRHGVHLVAGVRAAQGVRGGGVHARRPCRGQGQRPCGDERMGEHVPRPRPPRARRTTWRSRDRERSRIDLANHLAETD